MTLLDGIHFFVAAADAPGDPEEMKGPVKRYVSAAPMQTSPDRRLMDRQALVPGKSRMFSAKTFPALLLSQLSHFVANIPPGGPERGAIP